MRPTVLALAVLLLAGCVEPSAAPQDDGPSPVAANPRYGIPVRAYLAANGNMVCPPLTTCGNGSSAILLELRGNETAVSFELEALGGSPLDKDVRVRVEVRCEGAPGCERPLAQHEGVPPFRLAANATLPPRTLITVEARSFDPTPDPAGLLAPRVDLLGTVFVEAVPGPPLRVVETALHLRGVSGHCAFFVEANCTEWPNGSTWDLPINGTVRRLDLTATWTPTTPASETMRLAVSCFGVTTCPTGMAAEGPSPLRLDLLPNGITAGATLRVSLQWVSLAQPPAGPEVGGVPLRQPFAVDGALQMLVEADA